MDDVDQLLDLRRLPPSKYWERIMAAVRRLDSQPHRVWRLKVLVGDTQDVAVELPHLIAHLEGMDIHHETTREAGGVQGLLLGRSG